MGNPSLKTNKNGVIPTNDDNKKMNILDIGCGNGDIAEKISKKVNQVFCADISKEYVKICKKRFKKNKNNHVKLIKENYTDLSFLF